MARRGSFGHLPKSSPDLTATIVALMREYMNAVDRNMVDAWKNGGTVDGKPVTDARLLGHFKSRRDDLDPDDPQYQEWNNRITQYEFAIEESKMSVKWDNGQATPADMMAFYKKWEKKTPDNTEFDRTLRKSYGQWKKSATTRSRGSSAGAKASAHATWTDKVYKDKVQPADWANKAVSSMMFNWGLIPGKVVNGKRVPPDNIGEMEAYSDTDFEALLAIVKGGALTTERQEDVAYWTAELKKLDPNFTWSKAWFDDAAATAVEGLNTLVSKSTSQTESNMWGSIKADVLVTRNRIRSAPYVADLKAARAEWELAMENSAGNPQIIRDATEKYAERLRAAHKALDKPGANPNSQDTGVVPGINAELDFIDKALAGKKITGALPPTWMDSTAGTTAESGQDAASWVSLLNGMNEASKKVEDGGWAQVGEQKMPDGTTKQVFIYHSKDEPPPIGMTVVGGYDGAGNGITVYADPVPVFGITTGPDLKQTGGGVVRQDPVTGLPIKNEKGEPEVNPNPVLFTEVTVPNPYGDRPLKWYITTMPDGRQVRSLDPPVDPKLLATDPDGKLVVNIPQTATTAGQPFDRSDVLVFGPKKANADPLRPETPFETDAQGKETGRVTPGFYLSDEGVRNEAALDQLDIKDPNYRVNRNRILNTAQANITALQRASDWASDHGQNDRAKELGEQATKLSTDFRNLLVFSTAQASGNTSSLGLAKAATSMTFANATWNGSNIVSGGAPVRGSESALSQQDQTAQARSWMLGQLDEYDRKYSGGVRTPTGDYIPPRGAVVPPTASSFLPHAEGTMSLREQIEKGDPRQIKLPGMVTTLNNPYLPNVNLPAAPAPVAGAPAPTGGGIKPPVATTPPPAGSTAGIAQPPVAPPPPAAFVTPPTSSSTYKPPPPPEPPRRAPRPGGAPVPF